jgi:hypothetical protein
VSRADLPEVVTRRTPAWYWTRLELAIGVGLVLLVGLNLLFPPVFVGGRAQECWGAAGFLGMVVGLAWMIRIFRGPRDEPPRWRYRRR